MCWNCWYGESIVWNLELAQSINEIASSRPINSCFCSFLPCVFLCMQQSFLPQLHHVLACSTSHHRGKTFLLNHQIWWIFSFLGLCPSTKGHMHLACVFPLHPSRNIDHVQVTWSKTSPASSVFLYKCGLCQLWYHRANPKCVVFGYLPSSALFTWSRFIFDHWSFLTNH